jgi:hypothetical protein
MFTMGLPGVQSIGHIAQVQCREGRKSARRASERTR